MRSLRISPSITLLLFAAALPGQRFYPDDPIAKIPEPLHVEDAAYRKLNDYYDLFTHEFKTLGEPQPKKGPPIRAQSTNTLDEAPDDPAWFVNRIGSREMSIEEIMRGPGNENPPADGVWPIVAAKTEGVTPGFRIKDRTGAQYVLKFDPLDHPEMATGADVIGSLILHALGYNVPENYLVELDPDKLQIAEGATMPDVKGHDRPIEKFDVNHALLRVPKLPNGNMRAVASRLLSGKILGEFRYYGTRADDPNDIIPHEHRRDLRGLFVFDAWINHNDSRAINDLDSLVTEGSLQYIKHYLIDFGAILGSASVVSNTARDGNAYFYDPSAAMTQALTLGLYVPRWARAKYDKSPALGMLNSNAFIPDNWKPNYPNPAFDNRLPDDEFWAAKKVMAFSDEQIQAVVEAAEYSDPEDTALLVKYLQERRDKIGKVYFAKVLPLDGFRIEGSRLAFDDLGARYGFAEEAEVTTEWSRFDNNSGEMSKLESASTLELPGAIFGASGPRYFAAKIHAGEPAKSVTVFVRTDRVQPEVVGVERAWIGLQTQ